MHCRGRQAYAIAIAIAVAVAVVVAIAIAIAMGMGSDTVIAMSWQVKLARFLKETAPAASVGSHDVD